MAGTVGRREDDEELRDRMCVNKMPVNSQHTYRQQIGHPNQAHIALY